MITRIVIVGRRLLADGDEVREELPGAHEHRGGSPVRRRGSLVAGQVTVAYPPPDGALGAFGDGGCCVYIHEVGEVRHEAPRAGDRWVIVGAVTGRHERGGAGVRSLPQPATPHRELSRRWTEAHLSERALGVCFTDRAGHEPDRAVGYLIRVQIQWIAIPVEPA